MDQTRWILNPSGRMSVFNFLALAVAAIGSYLLLFKYWPLGPAAGSELKHIARVGQPTGDSFIIGTYNIHRSRGTDGRRDLNRIAEVIKDCDIVGLQEVEGSTWRGLNNQAYTLSEKLDCAVHFAPTRRRCLLPNRGNALLTRIPVEHWHREPLLPTTGRGYRNLTRYEVSMNGKTVHVLNTHLSHPDRQRHPFEQVLDVFEQYDHAILLGDFNVEAGHECLDRLQSFAVQDAAGLAGGPPGRVDWLLVRGLKIIDAWHTPTGPSDHPFYAARVSF